MDRIEFTDDSAVSRWADEQKQYAEGMREGEARYRFRKLILEHVYAITGKLTRPGPEAQQRMNQLVPEKIAKWRKDHPHDEPQPQKIHEEAYRESRPEIMALVDEIARLRAEAEALPRRRG